MNTGSTGHSQTSRRPPAAGTRVPRPAVAHDAAGEPVRAVAGVQAMPGAMPLRRLTEAPGRGVAEPRTRAVMQQQRAVGNRVVSRRLTELKSAGQRAPVGRALQRYDAFEHAAAADKARGSQTVTVGKVDLTSGEINALADLYGSPEALLQADPAELAKLRDLVRKQQANPASVTEADWDAASGGRYTLLNLKNRHHFAPQNAALVAPQAGTTPGQDNRATFTKYFLEAIDFAVKANAPIAPNAKAAQYRELSQKAWLWNGFAEHYLLDSFSAGHLFNKDDVLGLISSNLGSLNEKALGAVFQAAATRVWGSRSGFISKYQAKSYGFWWELNSADRYKSLLEGIYETAEGKEAVGSAIVKAAHDRLNTNAAGNGLVGVPVENDFGKWVLSGDKTLAKSPDTQRWMQLALEETRSKVQAALNGTITKSDPSLLATIVAYIPRPTPDSVKLINALIKDVTNPASGMSGAIAEIMDAEIEALFNALEARKFIRKKPP